MKFDVSTATTAELVVEYNRLSGKSIKKFSSRVAGEKQVAALLAKEGKAPAPAAPAKKAAKPKSDAPPVEKRSRSEAIKKSWDDRAVYDARSSRTHVSVRVDGAPAEVFKSVRKAFSALKLPLTQHIPFRMALKAAGTKTLEHDGKKFVFKVVAQQELQA